MEIIEVVRKNNMYVGKRTDMAIDFETQIGLFVNGQSSFDFFQKVGCEKLYYMSTSYKLLYDERKYNEAWEKVKEMNGLLTSIESDYDTVMKDERLENALGNVRINRIIFQTKVVTNGKNCEPCEC